MRPLLLAVAALLPLIDLVFAQPPAAGKKYAFLVGVNEYDHRQLANLKYAERDVTELAKVLKDNGFEVTLLLGSAFGDKKATRANIEKAVADLLKKVTKKDTLLTAFAGHGEQFKPDGAAEEQPFFCPVDAKPNDATRLYPFNDLLKKLDTDGAGTNLVLVDACRSINDANCGTRSGIDGSKAVGLSVGTVVFFACSRDQEARETEKADGGHGVFFHHVIDGLKGNAANKRGQVTWDGLVAHVKDQPAATYPDWFPGLPQAKWQQPQSIGNTSGAVVLVSGDMAKKPDAEAIQGEWSLTSMNENGSVVGAEGLKELVRKGVKRVYSFGQCKFTVKNGDEFKYKLDPSKVPAAIDMTADGEGTVLFGIYHLDGDSLTLCIGRIKDIPRPTEFKASVGSNLVLMKLERIKP